MWFMAGHMLRHREFCGSFPNEQNSNPTFPRSQLTGTHWNLFENHDCCTKDTVGGSLTVNNLLMAMYGGLVTQIAANEAQ